jgi:CheY-like chemotaxis protein/anti-sigma regulatory factor (Ser/Thr protein kinase)
VQLFQGTAQDKRLELISDYSPQPLPRIVGDPLRLRQIISNLVSNALKFTLQGSVSLSVVVADECIRITVTDTGIGISEASQQTLFDPFTQADQSTTKRYGGSGLGLAICAQFATLMGGSIEVESQTNQGSTFTVTLPLTLAQDKAPAAAPANGDLSLPQHPWILLVDDNAINRKVGTRLIESLGCSVMLAGSGPEAISACRENQFSAVLMDIQMPEMDGVEAMHAIRALAENTAPIIALTAYASIGDRDRYLSAGFDDYLEKPLKKKRLWEALSHCISTPDNENKDALTNIQQMPVLNQHAYEEFVELMDEEAPGLIERFQLDMDDACKEIAALAHQAPDECSKVAHKLKSSAGYIGAERMRGMFEWLELEMTNADKPQQQAALTLAEETAAATAAALQAPLA